MTCNFFAKILKRLKGCKANIAFEAAKYRKAPHGLCVASSLYEQPQPRARDDRTIKTMFRNKQLFFKAPDRMIGGEVLACREKNCLCLCAGPGRSDAQLQ